VGLTFRAAAQAVQVQGFLVFPRQLVPGLTRRKAQLPILPDHRDFRAMVMEMGLLELEIVFLNFDVVFDQIVEIPMLFSVKIDEVVVLRTHDAVVWPACLAHLSHSIGRRAHASVLRKSWLLERV